MQYKDLIQFEPITSVVKLVDSASLPVAENLVKSFVFSDRMLEDIQSVIIKNLTPEPTGETKGIQIVGSYGTGKSHLMSLISSIAENAQLLNSLRSDAIKAALTPIAGKYKVLRFEIGTDKALKDIVFTQIERFLSLEGVNYSFDSNSNLNWKTMLQDMLSVFEEKFPGKHFLIVIDEMLEYLKSRGPNFLSHDLMMLRQLGELSDNSRFKIMFGVQELVYRAPEFQFVAEMLLKVEDRYDDFMITKEDVSFVVKERLLKKDAHQKTIIRDHLLKFAPLFDGINSGLNEFVELFPVHPKYISYFQQIKHGKSQREILKVLSGMFEDLMEKEIPADKPGLITYDTYWNDLSANSSMIAIPDIRTVRDKLEIVSGHIQNHFTGARSNRREIAQRIANALAIRILTDDLDKHNGATAANLKEDLCSTIPGVDDAALLEAAIDSAAKQLVTATAGQYVAQDEINAAYFIRTEGGVNINQIIRDYADTVIKRNDELADQYYFEILQFILGIQQDSYRSGFKIWQDSLEWIDKKSFRLGYIFFGNPNERSTTEPIQQYYIFFCPLFSPIDRNDEPDEIYFDVSGLSDDFKDTIYLYGAAKSLFASASSNLKTLFKSQIDNFQKKAIAVFDEEYAQKTKVICKSESKSLKSFQLPPVGSTKDMIFKNVAARLLNKVFNDKFPDYPQFTDLQFPLTDKNYTGTINNALKKILSPETLNRNGEAILTGLGLWSSQGIKVDNSKYAESILRKLKEAGQGTVLNRSDILFAHYAPANLWYSVDYNIDYQLEFIVLAALAFKGEIEITWSSQKYLSATNIDSVLSFTQEDFFTFQHIKQPQGIPFKHLKALFASLGLPDLTTELDKPETIARIITEAKTRADRVVKTKAKLQQGLLCRSIPLMDAQLSSSMKSELESLAVTLDTIQSYNTYGKLKAFRLTEDELLKAFKAYSHCDTVDKLIERAEKFDRLVSYLYTAQSYIADEEPLLEEVKKAVNQLPSVLSSDKDAEFKKYEALLNSLIDRYADYYLGQYTRYRLTQKDDIARGKILSGDKKRICDILKDVDVLSKANYQNWLLIITSLRVADPSVSKAKIKSEPYHDFNPREYNRRPQVTVSQLQEQLDDILDAWSNALKSTFNDPSIQENMDILSASDKKLVEDFRSGKVDLTPENAPQLRNLISQFTQGIDKVEVTLEDIRKKINKPLTPQEAVKAFTEYIDTLCIGKERKKIRIIIK